MKLLLRQYLEGTGFTIRKDHYALKCVLNVADATGKLELWRLSSSEMKFDVFHWARAKHQGAAALSRPATAGEDRNPIDDAIRFMPVSSPPKNELKGCIKRSVVIDSRDCTGAKGTSPDYPPNVQLRPQGRIQPHSC